MQTTGHAAHPIEGDCFPGLDRYPLMKRAPRLSFIKGIRVRYLSRHNPIWVLTLGSLLVLLIGYVDYLVGAKLFVFEGFANDSLFQFYPNLLFRLRQYAAGVPSWWSFQRDLGAPIYLDLVNLSPFDSVLLLGERNFPYGLAYVEALKLLMTSGLMYGFLRLRHHTSCASIIGAWGMAFGGYMIVQGHWYHYTTYAVLLLALLVILEGWFRGGPAWPLPLLLALMGGKGILQLYQMSLFLGIYGLIRMGSDPARTWRETGTAMVKLLALLALGVGGNAFYAWPDLVTVTASPRGGSSLASATQATATHLQVTPLDTLTAFGARLLSPDLLGSWEFYQGPWNYLELSSAYVGLGLIGFLPLALRPPRHRWTRECRCFLILVIAYTGCTGLREGFNAFASTSFKYGALYISVLLVVCAVAGLDRFLHEPRTTFRPPLVVCGILILLLLIGDRGSGLSADRAVFNRTLVVLALFAGLLLASCRLLSLHRRYALWTVFVLTELAFSVQTTVSRGTGPLQPELLDTHLGYSHPDVLSALDDIRAQDDGFFRMEKSKPLPFLNDPMIQAYYGTTSYHGFPEAGIVQFARQLNLSPESLRLTSYRHGFGHRTPLMTLFSVKYYLAYRYHAMPEGYVPIGGNRSLTIGMNENASPLGFVYTSLVQQTVFEQLSMDDRERVLLACGVIDPTVPSSISVPCTATPSPTTSTVPFTLDQFSEDHLEGSVSMRSPGILFFSIPYDKGWTASVNGQPVDMLPVNYGFIGLPLAPGNHRVTLAFAPPGWRSGCLISVLCMGLITCPGTRRALRLAHPPES